MDESQRHGDECTIGEFRVRWEPAKRIIQIFGSMLHRRKKDFPDVREKVDAENDPHAYLTGYI